MLYTLIECLALIATISSIWPAVYKLKKSDKKSSLNSTYSSPATLISLLGMTAWLVWSIVAKDWLMVIAAISLILGEVYILSILLSLKKFIILLPVLAISTFLFLQFNSEYVISLLLLLSVLLHLLSTKKSSSAHSPLRWILESSEEMLWALTFILSGEIVLALPALLHIPLALLIAFKSSELVINIFNKFSGIRLYSFPPQSIPRYFFFLKNYYHELLFYKLSPEGNG
jgi:hypothetical protein